MSMHRIRSLSCAHCLALTLAHRPVQLSVSGGDVAPLMGHNAFLRWDALQNCSFVDPADGVRKFWSEAHVSEDFDCALRFQVTCLHLCAPCAACVGQHVKVCNILMIMQGSFACLDHCPFAFG